MPERIRADNRPFDANTGISLTLRMSEEFREQKKKNVNNIKQDQLLLIIKSTPTRRLYFIHFIIIVLTKIYLFSFTSHVVIFQLEGLKGSPSKYVIVTMYLSSCSTPNTFLAVNFPVIL